MGVTLADLVGYLRAHPEALGAALAGLPDQRLYELLHALRRDDEQVFHALVGRSRTGGRRRPVLGRDRAVAALAGIAAHVAGRLGVYQGRLEHAACVQELRAVAALLPAEVRADPGGADR